MTKLPYSLGIFLLVLGVIGIIQSVNPSFLATADSVNISTSKSSIFLSVSGLVISIIGAILIILKILKGRSRHG